MLNSYLIKGERPSLSLGLFYEPRLQYIANQSGSAKETVCPKIANDIEMLVCFICMGTQDRTLIDINHHYQITMNLDIEYRYIQSNIFIVSVAYLIFLDKEIAKKKFLPAGGS